MLTDPMRDSVLETMDGISISSWTPYVSLITAITSFRTPTVTEASYTGYGTRPSASFGAVGATSPVGGRQKATDALVTFPQNTGSSQDVIAWGLHTAPTGGTLRWIGMLDADPAIYGTATTADTITAPAHGLSGGQRIYVMAAPGAVIPTGLSEGTAYYVITSTLTTDTFQLSTTGAAGSAVDVTASGAAMFLPYTAVTIAAGATPEFASGALICQL